MILTPSTTAAEVMARPPAPHPDDDNAIGSVLTEMRNGTWLDAQHFPDLEWSVEGILPEGFGLIVAPPKAGKSWWVASIGLACAAGGMALGRIPVTKRPVLYLALEDGHRRLQGRFRTLLEDGPIPAGMHVITKAQPFEVPLMIEEFLNLYTAQKPLIILDTLGKVKPGKKAGEDSYTADYAIGTRLKDLIDAAPGSTLLVVHHTRKAESTDFVDAVSGTQGIAGSADFILVLSRKRQSDQAVLAVTGRDVPENEYALTTQDGRWSLDGMDLTDAAAAVSKRKDSETLGSNTLAILSHVAKHPDGVSPADVDKALGIENSKVTLSRLHDSGHLSKPRRGIYTSVTSVTCVTSEVSPQVTAITGDQVKVTEATEVTPLL